MGLNISQARPVIPVQKKHHWFKSHKHEWAKKKVKKKKYLIQLTGYQSYLNKVIYKKKDYGVTGHAASALVLLLNTREACPEMSTSPPGQVVLALPLAVCTLSPCLLYNVLMIQSVSSYLVLQVISSICYLDQLEDRLID